MRNAILIAAIASAVVLLGLSVASRAEDLQIDTQCSETHCRTTIGRPQPGITVIPPVPKNSILICAGTNCRTELAPEHLPIEREHEQQRRR